MKTFFRLFTIMALTVLVSCTQQTPMSIHWEMGKNDVKPGVCELYYTITNLSDQPITNEGWTLYFNYMSLHPIYTDGDQIFNVNARVLKAAGNIYHQPQIVLNQTISAG